ncbi:MAG: hypothetical protein LBJ20_08300, partial [Candidatus Methanoplasma sp.]|nr:hypothetical protein [Candidatus Methanoplasma sp.]
VASICSFYGKEITIVKLRELPGTDNEVSLRTVEKHIAHYTAMVLLNLTRGKRKVLKSLRNYENSGLFRVYPALRAL